VLAQLAVTEATTAMQEEAAINTLVGSGVTISNINVECGSGTDFSGVTKYAFGSFDGSAANLGLQSGIVLTTGSATDAEGPNVTEVSNSITSGAASSDAALEALSGVSINDVCRVTFDVVPLGDTLQFYYVFGSEEFYQYVCTQYNDVFGFFISGPNPDGGVYDNVNIAIIPDTDPPLPVAISTVNNGYLTPGSPCTIGSGEGINVGDECPCNPLYFIDNNFLPDNNANTTVQYRGFTRPLTAFAKVIPCETYTLKLAIGDGFDDVLDSGVFIESGSLSSKNVGVSSTTGYSPFDDDTEITVEGCVDATIYFEFPFDIYDDAVVTYQIIPCDNTNPEATVGDDFTDVTGLLEIAAGTVLDSIYLEIFEDNMFEGIECFAVNVTGIEIQGCNFDLGESITEVLIYDQLITDITDTTAGPICPGTSVVLPKVTGAVGYEWSPPQFLDDPTSQNPVATLDETTEFVCLAQVNACVDTFRVTVEVAEIIAPVTDTLYQLCEEDPITLVGGDGALSYTWTAAGDTSCTTCLSCTSCQSPTFEPNGSGSAYRLNMVVAPGCPVSVIVKILYKEPEFLEGPTTISKCTEDDQQVMITGGAEGSYVWSPTTGLSCSDCSDPTISVTEATTYTITATDDIGCSDEHTLEVTVLSNSAAAGEDIFDCTEIVDGVIGLPEIPGFSYSWSPATGLSSTTEAQPTVNIGLLNGQTQQITYTLDLQDENGCNATDQVTVSAYSDPFIKIAGEDTINIVIGQVAPLVATGAGDMGSYEWWPVQDLSVSMSANSSAKPLESRMYFVEGTNEFACSGIDSVYISVVEPPAILFPGAFSPNGDGVNDFFKPVVKKDILELKAFAVYDRWGKEIWSGSGSLDDQWDGRYENDGTPVELGVYVFFCQYLQLGEELPKLIQGNVTVIR